MPSFGMRRIPYALTLFAAIVLAAVGCLTAVAAPAHAASDLSLVILPDQGENAIYNFVDSATSSIDVTIYELKDTTLESDLVVVQPGRLQHADRRRRGRGLVLHRVHLHPPEDDHRR